MASRRAIAVALTMLAVVSCNGGPRSSREGVSGQTPPISPSPVKTVALPTPTGSASSMLCPPGTLFKTPR